MIIESIFNIIVSILLGIISIFPTIPEIRTNGFDSLFGLLGLANSFVNLGVFVSCLVVAITVMNARLLWSVIMWVVRKIPNIS